MRRTFKFVCFLTTIFAAGASAGAFSVDPPSPKGGEAVLLSFKPSPFLSYEITHDSKTYKPYPSVGGKREIFLPIAIETSGKTSILVSKKLLGVKIASAEIPFTVTARRIPVIRLSPTSERMRDLKPALPDERERLIKALSIRSPVRLAQSPFLSPLDGKQGEVFGVKREGARYSYYHKGVDISTRAGVPVAAANAGAVALASENFNVTGKTVVIDHGQGMVSCYYHLATILVSEGEKVAKGQNIGLVGSTGWSTGPHLHFGTYLQGEAIDPLWLINFTSSTGTAAQ